ncbi:MAG: 23S rRNA (adenine(2503)-C(2))-methyltransferase RlmN [Chloroflexota bacterium]|jgi:23S rRNA (adenine2503-C2)-methyltransferase
MRNQPIDLLSLKYDDLVSLFSDWGHGEYHAGLVWRHLYADRLSTVEDMPGLRPTLRSQLLAEAKIGTLAEQVSVHSQDGSTDKYLLALPDGQTIETVLMHYPGRATACVSTQVGCAMGCVFCATGQMGFVRHLSAGEIVAQVLHVINKLEKEDDQLRNVVLMGMGEPLHNYDETMTAIDILTDDRGLAIGPRYITLSTVGLPRAIRRLADEDRPINLAVSLHAATDEERSAIVPINKRWPLSQLLDACRYYIQQRGRRIFFELALISGKNDSEAHAHAVGRLLGDLEAHLNLIPLNLTQGYDGKPSSDKAILRFQGILAEYGLPSTVRQRRGIDVDAGCGQLRTWAIAGRD